MSHPYWPQPGYIYKRSLPHAGTSMGDYGSKFTHGSFSTSKNPWALPHYVAVEETGIDGFGADDGMYGFGGDGVSLSVGGKTITCDAQRFLTYAVEWLADNLPMGEQVEWLANKLGTSMKSTLKSSLQSAANKLGTAVFAQLLQKANEGSNAFMLYVQNNVAPGLSAATGVPAATITALAGGTFYNATRSFITQCGGDLVMATDGSMGVIGFVMELSAIASAYNAGQLTQAQALSQIAALRAKYGYGSADPTADAAVQTYAPALSALQTAAGQGTLAKATQPATFANRVQTVDMSQVHLNTDPTSPYYDPSLDPGYLAPVTPMSMTTKVALIGGAALLALMLFRR